MMGLWGSRFMGKRIKTLDELKDSRILFEKNPPVFGYMLILSMAVFLIIILIWSIRTPKVYTMQAHGIVTNEAANYVMCTYAGEIADCKLEEGMLVDKGDILFSIKSIDYDLQEKQLLLSKEIYEKRISQYELLVQAIKDDTNYFDESNPSDELYYSIYEAYKSRITQNILDTSAYSDYGYTDEQIEAEIAKNQGKISEIYYEAIEVAQSAIVEAENQIAIIDAQLVAISSGKNEYVVRATASGELHLIGNYKNGMIIQPATIVANITPQNSEPIIEAYVSTSDMARMHEGDAVQIVIDGLSQNVYGSISGIVKQIDSNVTIRESEEGSLSQAFKILIKMDTDYLVSQSGEKIDIANGMTAVARISYDKVTYFNYVLEKLGFKTK